jgi:type I restriction enzyme M protein
MILHGIETPNIIHKNTLTENVMDVEEKDKFDYIIANPPFGGKERAEVQQNFEIKSGETAYLFLQHFIKMLKAGGTAGIVIKNTFLSNDDAIELRKTLLQTCNLYAILDLPQKVFTAGVKTVVLFFKKGEPTKKIWYYQLNLDRNLGKTNPLTDDDLAEFLKLQKDFKVSENSWFLNVKDINQETIDMSVKNPNKKDETVYREPKQIIEEMKQLDKQAQEILKKI